MDNLEQQHTRDKVVFGFWVYLMTDCVLFASLFAAYAVLHANTFGGPGGRELFDLPFVLVESLILLTSSFTCGMAMLAAHRGNKGQTIGLFIITLLLGISFLGMEIYEFSHLIHAGHGPQASAFLSAFFTLVGTHGLHILIGSLWMIALIAQVFLRGLTPGNIGRLTLLSLFWHFLDVIWIFIFTVVYLMGAI